MLLSIFVQRERQADDPILPPRLFANPTIRLGVILSFLINVLMFGTIVLIPVFLQLVARFSAGSSGGLMVPLLLGMALTAICTSQFLRRTGRYRGLVPAGLGLATLAYTIFSTLTATSQLPLIIGALVIMGMCIGLSIPVINVAVQNSAEPRDLGVAIASLNFAARSAVRLAHRSSGRSFWRCPVVQSSRPLAHSTRSSSPEPQSPAVPVSSRSRSPRSR